METIIAATDGSSLSNPGPGGWCWFVNENYWRAGNEKHASNNRMEIYAVYALLKQTNDDGLSGEKLEIQADSRYTIDALTKWIYSWKKNSWMTSNKKPVANKELIVQTFELLQGRDVKFTWVKGHAGHNLNQAADRRALVAAKNAKEGKIKTFGPSF